MRHDEILGLIPRLNYGLDDRPDLQLLLLELLFWAVIIVVTIALVRFRPALVEKAENRIRAISQHTRFWLAAFPLFVIVLRLAMLSWIPVPAPDVHDEFSYLLAADTFAHGRLTNPPSPLWVHFESFHMNVLPTYQSMYPPAQGLALALGQRLTGLPWAGVLLSVALMCAAIYWMLLGWLPAPWAWLGGAFACVRFGTFSYWVNSYWGGAVAALGGALVLGAFPRLRRELKAPVALVFAAGLLILANSRPLEGFLFSLPLLISVAFLLVKRLRVNWTGTAQAALPAMALLVLGAGWMLYYNWRGTGHPLVIPYQVNFETYHITRPFFFQKPNPIPQYRHLEMRAFYVMHELPGALLWKDEADYFTRVKASIYYGFFLWPFLLLLAPCILALARGELRIVLLSTVLVVADLMAQIWPPHSHYAAPIAGAMVLMLLYSLRYMRSHREGRLSAHALWGSRAVVMVFALWMISPIAEKLWNPFLLRNTIQPPVADSAKLYPIPMSFQRARIQSDLRARGGKHLVIVGYPARDVPSQEWVYNEADIDNSKIVWARDMGYLRNLDLLEHYPDRQVWYVNRGDVAASLVPYDRVSAPFKLAFDRAVFESDSQANPKQGQQPASGAAQAPPRPAAAALSVGIR
jgi:hypothetical protein